MILGSHLSISGGLEKALQSASGYGFGAVAMFLRNQRQWQAGRFLPKMWKNSVKHAKKREFWVVVAHGSYLVNLAGEADIRRKSIHAVIEDLTRCGLLGIEYLVLASRLVPGHR